MLVNTRDSVFIKGTCTCMARVVDDNNTNITQNGTSTIFYSVYSLASDNTRTVVTGFDNVELTNDKASIISDTLVTDDTRWDVDTTGYNFVHTIPLSGDKPFDALGDYIVEYLITPTSGERCPLRFRIRGK